MVIYQLTLIDVHLFLDVTLYYYRAISQ